MRIVQLITQSAGGPVDHAVDLAAELARQGHQSHLVGPVRAGDPLARRLEQAGAHWHHAECSSARDLAGLRDVRRTVASIAPDVVHCQDRRAGLLGRGPGTPVRQATVYTLHGVPDAFSHLVRGNLRAAEGSRRTQTTNMVAESLLARAPRSRLVTVCDALADYARDHLRVPADRVRAVHNGLGPEWLDRDRFVSGTTPVRAGTDDGLTVAWLGLFAPVKRVPALVEAVADVPGLRLRLVGDGPERPAVEDAVARAGADDRVELLGFRSDPAPLVADADVFALTSAAEACPIALLQAMALGRPVVASRVGGVPEIVRDGVDGLLVTPGDDDALRAALRRLRDEPELRHRLGAAAADRVRDRFTMQRCADRLLDVYREVAA